MKILYFTSTGNCLYIAKRIGGELLSIPWLQKENRYEIDDDMVGIVVPVYGFDVPRPVRFYLKNARIKAEYVFLVMTYGNMAMAAAGQMRKLLAANNTHLHYAAEIKMVDNYLPLFEIAKQLEIQNDKDIMLKIDAIAADIAGKKHCMPKHTWFEKMVSNIVSSYYASEKGGRLMNKAVQNFTMNSSCNGCGICRNVCPMGNISGSEKPAYLNKCEFCLACIHHCPQNAIHLNNEKSAKRFRNEHITVSEIINANNQTLTAKNRSF
jgi:ferredoxin/protein involved in ribonucleotide reduction